MFSDWNLVEKIWGKGTEDFYYKGCGCSQKYESCSCDPRGWYQREIDVVTGYRVRRQKRTQTQTAKGYCILGLTC